MTQEKSLALPASLEEVRGFADAFVKSGMFQDTKQLAQAIVKIQAGRELGLAPVYSMQNINLIRDRLTTSANTMAMLVKRSVKYNYRIKEHTEQVCIITFFEDGKPVGESSFSMEDAKRANLIKPDSGWVKFPRAMLFSRAISQGARIYAPDAIGGIYTDEEIRSIPDKPEPGAVVNSEATEIKPVYSTSYEEQMDKTSDEQKALPPAPEAKSKPVEAESKAERQEWQGNPEIGITDRLVTQAEIQEIYSLLGKNSMGLKALGAWMVKEKGWTDKSRNLKDLA